MSNRKAAFSAENYDGDILNTIPYYDEVYNQIADVVSVAFLNKAVSWLDVGCGTGRMEKVALEQCNVEKMICIDESSVMLEIAKQKIGSFYVDFFKLPTEEINYNLQFDMITAILVNHYLAYEERMKKLYLKRWEKYQYSKGKSIKECEKHLSRNNMEYFPITMQEQIRILKECGFRSIEIFCVSICVLVF